MTVSIVTNAMRTALAERCKERRAAMDREEQVHLRMSSMTALDGTIEERRSMCEKAVSKLTFNGEHHIHY